MTTTGRPEIDTLRLLRDIVDEIGTNEAIAAGGTIFGYTVTLVPTQSFTASEPEVKVLRHLLDRLRHLDMPSSDVRLDRVFEIVDRLGVKPGEWSDSYAQARSAYADAQVVRNMKVEDPDVPRSSAADDPRWITPREAFGLWAYGGVIHHDYAKERKWQRLGPLGQAPVRDMAHVYAMMLIDEGDFFARLLRAGLMVDLDAPPEP